MGYSVHDPANTGRPAWNAGRRLGAKHALEPRQAWAIRFRLDRERRTRERAMFDVAIDSELRGCDIVELKSGDRVSGGRGWSGPGLARSVVLLGAAGVGSCRAIRRSGS